MLEKGSLQCMEVKVERKTFFPISKMEQVPFPMKRVVKISSQQKEKSLNFYNLIEKCYNTAND